MHTNAKVFNTGSDDGWSKCLGRINLQTPDDTAAPCYEALMLQNPNTCACVPDATLAKTCKAIGGESCSIGMHFKAPATQKVWDAQNLAQGCFPPECNNDDITVLTQQVYFYCI